MKLKERENEFKAIKDSLLNQYHKLKDCNPLDIFGKILSDYFLNMFRYSGHNYRSKCPNNASCSHGKLIDRAKLHMLKILYCHQWV